MNAREAEALRWFRQAQADLEVVRTLHDPLGQGSPRLKSWEELPHYFSLTYISLCDIISNMKSIKTVKCKLEVNKETSAILFETMNRFAACCNDVLSISKQYKTTNKVKLQHLCYYELKAKYNLPANLIIRAIARVAASSKSKKPPEQFKPASIAYDQRTFCFIEPKEEISISTHEGRQHIKLRLGNFQRGVLKSQKPTSASLFYRKNKKAFFINIVLEKEVIAPFGDNPVGIDRGLYNLVTTSKGQRFSGKQVMYARNRFANKRQQLQAKDTKSAEHRLKQLSSKEHRWMTNQNHIISKAIVSNCEPGDMIILEELKYIRDRIKSAKKQRQILHSWAFGQLQEFIEYKALEAGIPVVYVDPRYTSQRCSKCGQIGVRSKHQFWCPFCYLSNHADYNAAYNIQRASLAPLR